MTLNLLSDEDKTVFPVCAVTRAQSHTFADQLDLSETYLSSVNTEPEMATLCEILSFDNVNEGELQVKNDSMLNLKLGKKALKAEQSKDPSVDRCRATVVAAKKLSEQSVAYFLSG